MIKYVLSAILFLASVLVTAFLWREPYLLTLVVMIISVLLNVLHKWRYILFFIICAVLGPLTEAVCIAFGAWQYGNSQIIGIPIWLPFIWGNASIFFVGLWHFLEKRRAK